LKVVRIPARQSGTPTELIDLTPYYNGSLNGWLESSPEDNLGELPTGMTRIAGVPFDVRGVIQLGSRNNAMLHIPAAVSNIVVGVRWQASSSCTGQSMGRGRPPLSANILSTSRTAPPRRFRSPTDAKYWIGTATPPTIRSGMTTRQAGRPSKIDSSGTQKTARLYTSRWVNPRPNLQIQHIDFVSSMALSSPFLVAISARE
jgi:hypothetical protein